MIAGAFRLSPNRRPGPCAPSRSANLFSRCRVASKPSVRQQTQRKIVIVSFGDCSVERPAPGAYAIPGQPDAVAPPRLAAAGAISRPPRGPFVGKAVPSKPTMRSPIARRRSTIGSAVPSTGSASQRKKAPGATARCSTGRWSTGGHSTGRIECWRYDERGIRTGRGAISATHRRTILAIFTASRVRILRHQEQGGERPADPGPSRGSAMPPSCQRIAVVGKCAHPRQRGLPGLLAQQLGRDDRITQGVTHCEAGASHAFDRQVQRLSPGLSDPRRTRVWRRPRLDPVPVDGLSDSRHRHRRNQAAAVLAETSASSASRPEGAST